MVFLEYFVTILVRKVILEQTVPGFVHLTVNLIHVDTQTGGVYVPRVGREIIVLQNVICPMERIAGIHAVYTVSTRRVTDSTEVVCLAVQKGRDVTEFFFQ